TGAGTLSLTTPPDGDVAPPGYYMLFLVDSRGVPSGAQSIQLTPYTTPPPTGVITSPVADTTIVAGSSLVFGTTSNAAQYSWVVPGGRPTKPVLKNTGPGQFDTPGTYTAALTVIDGSGNSDPSPPARVITVTPPTPDFSIDVDPERVTVTPGQPATFTVSVTPVAGFTGRVTLGVENDAGFPPG